MNSGACHKPSVAVIIPALDAAATIGRSVRSALAQPEAREVVVIDDGRSFEQPRERQERESQRRDWRQDATITKEESHEPRESSRPGRDPYRYL